MSYSVGRLDVECPDCGKPIVVLIEGEVVKRHVIPGVASNGSLTVLLGVNQVALDLELERHVTEHHVRHAG